MGVCQEQEKELKRHPTEMEKMGKKKVDKVRKREAGSGIRYGNW
jgi:hypothetical protein